MLTAISQVRVGQTQVDFGPIVEIVDRPAELPPYFVLRFGFADYRYDKVDQATGLETLIDIDTLLANVVPGLG